MDLYIKKGRRYKKIKSFMGFPCDGIWLVHTNKHSQTCLSQLNEINNLDIRKVGNLSPYIDTIASFIDEYKKKKITSYEISRKIILKLSEIQSSEERNNLIDKYERLV